MDKDAFLKHIQDAVHRTTGKNVTVHAANLDGSDLDSMPEEVKRVMAAEFIESLTEHIQREEAGKDDDDDYLPSDEALIGFVKALQRMRQLVKDGSDPDELNKLMMSHAKLMLDTILKAAIQRKHNDALMAEATMAIKAVLAVLVAVNDADDMDEVKAATDHVRWDLITKLILRLDT